MTGTDVLKESIRKEEAMANEIVALRAERDALRAVYEAADDFVFSHGTRDFRDQYLMLCGVLKAYYAALAVQPITGDAK